MSVKRKEGVIAARSYNDYEVEVAEHKLPEGVSCTRMIYGDFFCEQLAFV